MHPITSRIVCAFAAALLYSAGADAQLFRSYVASTGSDANPCTLQAPCRLLPAALAAVADGGEIWMLDSANYNAAQVNIDKTVSILAIPGALGSVVAPAGGGDAINIATASVSVTLRNLSITRVANGMGTNGIVMSAGDKLTVENSIIYNFPAGHGIRVTTPAAVRVVDTVLRDNANGIWLQGGARADISGSKIMGLGQMGIRANGNVGGVTTTVAVTRCVFGGNFYGISAYADNAAGTSRVSVTGSTFSNNDVGVRADSFAGTVLVTVANSMLTANGKAFSQEGAGATLESLGNNTVRQNTNPNDGTVTAVPPT